MEIRDIVRQRSTGKRGVIMPNTFFPEDGPFAVIMDGQSSSSSLDERDPDFEIIGHEIPVADLDGCRGNGDADTCIFLAVNGPNLECTRHTDMHMGLIFKNMVAKREPVELYPLCKRTSNVPAAASVE